MVSVFVSILCTGPPLKNADKVSCENFRGFQANTTIKFRNQTLQSLPAVFRRAPPCRILHKGMRDWWVQASSLCGLLGESGLLGINARKFKYKSWKKMKGCSLRNGCHCVDVIKRKQLEPQAGQQSSPEQDKERCRDFPFQRPLNILMHSSESRSFSMAKARNGKAGAHDKSSQGGPLSRDLLPHVFAFYNCTLTARDMEVYSPNVLFEDPYLRAEGIEQTTRAFFSLPKMVREAKLVDYSVQENETSPGCGEIVIDSKHHYNFLGITMDFESLITLQVEHGKIVRHIDLWGKRPLMNRETISFPLVGRLAEGMRKFLMFTTYCLMWFAKIPRS